MTRRWIAGWPWTAAVAIACLLIAILHNSLHRTVLGINEEADLAGGLGPDAQRILTGEPLRLDFHPPGYSFVLLLGRLVSGSWIDGGLWISGISAMVFLAASMVTFKRLVGTAAAWGVLVACACSTVFLCSASTASGDLMFAALFSLMLALVVQAMSTPDRLWLWLSAGAVAAFVFLTRTNGIVAAAVLLTPFLAPADRAKPIYNLAAVAATFLLPLLLWALYATTTASPLTPSGTYLNLAAAAYGEPGLGWGEQAALLRPQFDNLIDVLAHDPARMVRQIGGRLLSLPQRLANSITWLPLALLAAPGLLLTLWRHWTPGLLVYLLVATGLTMLTGVITYQPRYFLFLLPLIGAMAGVAFGYLLDLTAVKPPIRAILVTAALAVIAVVFGKAYAPVLPKLETIAQREFAEAIPRLQHQTEPHATIYARKPNLGFETGRSIRFLPSASTLALLHQEFCMDLAPGDPAYLYFGTVERRYRADLYNDLNSAEPVPWLELIDKGLKTDWALYRIRLYEPDQPPDQRCSTSRRTGPNVL